MSSAIQVPLGLLDFPQFAQRPGRFPAHQGEHPAAAGADEIFRCAEQVGDRYGNQRSAVGTGNACPAVGR